MTLIHIRSWLTYLAELFILLLVLVSGMYLIDNYFRYLDDKREYDIKSDLHDHAVMLSVETLSAMNNSIYHYDKYAQKQLVFEQLVSKTKEFEVSEEIDPISIHLNAFLSSVIGYMQYATMLKTSFRFVSSMELSKQDLGAQQKNQISSIIALIAAFRNNADETLQLRIKEKIEALEQTFKVLETQNFRWNMFQLHVTFILDQHIRASKLLLPIQDTKISKTITENLKRLTLKIEGHYLNMAMSSLITIVSIFSLFLLAMTRQSKHLQKANIASQQAAESKTQFLANMSHEIRTPMNGILGLSDILLKTNLDHQQRSYLEKLKFSAKSLTIIINDILDFSKIESKKLQIESVPFELNKLLDNVKTMVGRSANEKGLELIFEVDERLQNQYQGDPVRIGQILLNLASNAIKFTHEGHILLKVLLIKQEDALDHVAFTVKDTGIGITDEQRKKLFKRFSQAEASTTRKYGGTGLGLSICNMLTELMNGHIEVTSEKDRGSVFSVYLPLSTNIECKATDDTRFDGHTALLVEDNLLTSEITTNVLSSLGFNVTAALSGKRATEMLAQRQYDVVLLDWKLPDLVGLDLINEVERYKDKFDHLIVFTGYDADYLSTGLTYPVLNKPLIKHDLISTLVRELNDEDESVGEQDTPLIEVAEEKDYSHLFILLVEDNEINKVIALNVLEELNVKVECAVTGVEAVDKAKVHEFDLILMDIQMPEMDGIEATQHIRKFKSSDTLPIVALTANVLPEEVALYIEIGMNHHIGKPFEREELEDAIKLLVSN